VEPHGAFSVIDAEAPLAGVQRYITDLRALTGGRGTFTLAPSHYAEVPAHVQEQVLQHLAPIEA
jgi:elongation factor G